MNENLSAYSLRDIALSIPSTVPPVEADNSNGWGHGTYRQSSLPRGRSYRTSDSVRNKHSRKLNTSLCLFLLDFCGEIYTGQSINVTKGMSGSECFRNRDCGDGSRVIS